ncbi:MAG TPA: DUF5668 domain-containing protein [Steroidobacteraceae bacterium]
MRPRSHSGAIVLILIGVVFLLVNLGVLPIRDLARLLSTWWPLILIAVGVWQLARTRKSE